jgi:hypothetical protein
MPLRFPNPGSDMRRLIEIYRILFRGTAGVSQFDLDDMGRILTSALQASSRGAVGAAALARSNNRDRSRDPIYNQSKMYSEVFRMLGWLRPVGGKKLVFRTTILGGQLVEEFAASRSLTYGLFRESLLGICFPNPATNNLGVANQRPIGWLLRLMALLDGSITRHEMIIGVLAFTDDQIPNAMNTAAARINRVRGKKVALMAAVEQEARQSQVSVITLENYTRFPVGVMKSPGIGWGRKELVTGLYERPVEALVLTPAGSEAGMWVGGAADVRETALETYPLDERAAFATRSFYGMLLRAGLPRRYVDTALIAAETGSAKIVRELALPGAERVLYSPVQQAPDPVLELAQAS